MNIQTNQRKNALANKPTYTPDQWERKDGYFKDGVFHKPSYVVFRNGEPLQLNNDFDIGYSYIVASHIIMLLQAVSTDNFIINPISWQPMNDYNVMMEGKA